MPTFQQSRGYNEFQNSCSSYKVSSFNDLGFSAKFIVQDAEISEHSAKLLVGNAPKPSTMTTITIEQAGKYDGQEVTLRGWLYNLRESGKLLFPIFRDGTGMIQGVVSLKEQPDAFAALRDLTQESSVIVTGKIRAEQRAPGGFEMGVTAIEVVQRVPDDTPYPIQLKEHGVDFLLDHRHLWIRTPRQAAILRIRARSRARGAQLHGLARATR